MITTIPALLHGRVALITGGSCGIGAGIALDFAREGCSHIAITYSNNRGVANEVLSSILKISTEVKTAAIEADITSVTFGPDTIAASLKSLAVDRIDIVVSNAVLFSLESLQKMEEHAKETFDNFMTANVRSPFQLALAAILRMPPGGKIINISSVASKRPNVSCHRWFYQVFSRFTK